MQFKDLRSSHIVKTKASVTPLQYVCPKLHPCHRNDKGMVRHGKGKNYKENLIKKAVWGDFMLKM